MQAFPEESTSLDSDDIQQYCKTMWIFSSEVDTSYYVFGNEHWMQFTTNFGLVPATEFDISCTKCEKDIVLVLPSFLKRKGLSIDDIQCLILITKRNLLITGYWCKHPNYLFTKEKDSHFQLLY